MPARKKAAKGERPADQGRLYSMDEIAKVFKLPATQVGVTVADADTSISSMARRVVCEVFDQKQPRPAAQTHARV